MPDFKIPKYYFPYLMTSKFFNKFGANRHISESEGPPWKLAVVLRVRKWVYTFFLLIALVVCFQSLASH